MDLAYGVGCRIVVNGAEAVGLAGHVYQVVVDEQLQLPAMFAITLTDDQDRDIINRTGLRAGADVEIFVTGQGAEGDGHLVKGDVVAVECDYDHEGSVVVVRGYAASHRLHRGRRTRTFLDSTDSDIVKRIADEARIPIGEIEATSEVHQHVTQANQTDWEFLTGRARAIGYGLGMFKGRLGFGKPGKSSEAPPATDADADAAANDARYLVFHYNLLAFHGRLSAAEQVAKVEVRGWNQDKKEPVVARASGGTVSADLKVTDPSRLARTFGDPTYVAVTTPVSSEREAGDAARALAERIGSAFAEADGTSVGSTVLHAGTAVRVSRVTKDFDGAYVLSHTRHVIDGLGYRTHFTISGRHDRSLLGLVANGNGGGHATPHGKLPTDGLVRGVVSENDDPQKLGRVTVRLPWLDADFTSAWAPVMQLGAGPASGTLFLPAVNDEVLVGFEHGEIDRPVVVGGLFNSLDTPPPYGQLLDHGAVIGRGIYSRLGHRLMLHDANDVSGITFMTSKGEVSIGLNAKESKLVIQSQGAVDIDAVGEIKLHGSKVTVQADGELVLTGATVRIN